MSRHADWARAYARQARADFDLREHLQAIEAVQESHKLLLLRMACEKLTKAYLCGGGIDPDLLQRSHAYIARNLPLIIRQEISISNPRNAGWVLAYSGHLAREIELLAPAVRSGGQRPDNCEYPWEDADGRLHSPLDWTFAASNLLLAPAGRTFLKLIRDAIDRLA